MGFCRAVAPALCPLPGKVTPGAGQDPPMGTRDWGTQEGSIWRDLGSGTAFPVQEGLGRVPARSAGARQGAAVFWTSEGQEEEKPVDSYHSGVVGSC